MHHGWEGWEVQDKGSKNSGLGPAVTSQVLQRRVGWGWSCLRHLAFEKPEEAPNRRAPHRKLTQPLYCKGAFYLRGFCLRFTFAWCWQAGSAGRTGAQAADGASGAWPCTAFFPVASRKQVEPFGDKFCWRERKAIPQALLDGNADSSGVTVVWPERTTCLLHFSSLEHSPGIRQLGSSWSEPSTLGDWSLHAPPSQGKLRAIPLWRNLRGTSIQGPGCIPPAASLVSAHGSVNERKLGGSHRSIDGI